MVYIDARQFLECSVLQPIADVRSPAEYKQGHIPGAINIPLFDDEERKRIGILYKNSGREASVLLGLEIVGPKMTGFVKDLKKITPSKDILLHCWRGGMRSKGMAWLFETAGFNVSVLQGGYKSYRAFIRQKLAEPAQLVVLGGYTGSGKSEILEFIRKNGEQVLDLEKIASHKGSAFGDLGQEKQPTNEQFENNLYFELQKLNLNSTIWVEDESRGIGTVGIPEPFYRKMKNSRLIFADVEKNIRVDRLVKEYAGFNEEPLVNAIKRITQRLGGLNTRLAIEALVNKDFTMAASLLLDYYDKAYLKGVSDRDPSLVYAIALHSGNPEINASEILAFYNKEIKLQLHQLDKVFL
jgi:tRNA 2-selenouridine synthase